MLGENCLIWNVRGLNSRARHNVVRELVDLENISLLSLQETKLQDCTESVVRRLAVPILISCLNRLRILAEASFLPGDVIRGLLLLR